MLSQSAAPMSTGCNALKLGQFDLEGTRKFKEEGDLDMALLLYGRAKATLQNEAEDRKVPLSKAKDFLNKAHTPNRRRQTSVGASRRCLF